MSRTSSHRSLLALLMLSVLSSPFQMIYACEKMDAMEGMKADVQFTCCCDEPCVVGMTFERGATVGEQSSMSFEGCCDVSYLDTPDASTRASPSLVLMLDASQPPPIPASFDFQGLAAGSCIILSTLTSPPLPERPVYLLTNRFRV